VIEPGLERGGVVVDAVVARLLILVSAAAFLYTALGGFGWLIHPTLTHMVGGLALGLFCWVVSALVR
jgi:hypothetical protein